MTAYFDRPSIVHALDPRVKIAWSVVVSLLAVVLGRPLWLGGLLAITLRPGAWCVRRGPGCGCCWCWWRRPCWAR